MGLSLRAYAAHRKALGLSGTSDTAVRKAIASGRIQALPDGTVDPAAADAAWAGATDNRKLRGDAPSARPEMHLDGDDATPVIVASPTAGMDATTAAKFNDVRTKRELLKLKADLRKDKVEEGLLIQRKPQLDLFFKTAVSFRSAVEQWPDIGGPIIAAKFGIRDHDMIQALRDELRTLLLDLAKETENLDGADPR